MSEKQTIAQVLAEGKVINSETFIVAASYNDDSFAVSFQGNGKDLLSMLTAILEEIGDEISVPAFLIANKNKVEVNV
jgi:hypothetical protein